MNIMVDTMVLIYALEAHAGQSKKNQKYWDLCKASLALLNSIDNLRIPSVAWAEFLRVSPESTRAAIEKLSGEIEIDQFDGRAAVRAAQLLEFRVKQKVCPQCLGSLDAVPCKGCGNRRSAQQNINDAFIVATAEMTEGIHILYSFDKGVLDLGGYAQGISVIRPPHPLGDLFDPAKNPVLEEKRGQGAKKSEA